MPGFNPENINIHDLTIEEPEKEQQVYFNPEKEITQKDWDEMIKHLERSRGSNWHAFFKDIFPLIVLDSRKNFNLNDEAFKGALEVLESNQKDTPSGVSRYAIEQLARMRLCFPDKKRPLPYSWDQMISQLKTYRKDDTTFWKLAMDIKILFPEKDLDVVEQDYQKGVLDVEEMKQSAKRGKPGAWYYFSTRAVPIKLLNPNINFGLNENDWENMKKQLRNHNYESHNTASTDEWRTFAHHAMNMKILAAEKIEITDNGLKITMPDEKVSLESGTPELPEQRKF